MNKKNTITLRLTDDQLAWLGALSRRSKRSKSEVIRSLIEQDAVNEARARSSVHSLNMGRYENVSPVTTCTLSVS